MLETQAAQPTLMGCVRSIAITLMSGCSAHVRPEASVELKHHLSAD